MNPTDIKLNSLVQYDGHLWRVFQIYPDQHVDLILYGVGGTIGPIHVSKLAPGKRPWLDDFLLTELGEGTAARVKYIKRLDGIEKRWPKVRDRAWWRARGGEPPF